MSKGNLFYTYIDECKQNYLTQMMREKGISEFQEYSVTSLTFESNDYQTKLEVEWREFCNQYNFDSSKALHFVDFKKLLRSSDRNNSNPMYAHFVENNEFSVEKLKSFFRELAQLIQNSDFFIVHTDFYWDKRTYLTKRNNYNHFQFKSSPSRNVAPQILNAVPYVAMRKHLDSLLLTLLRRFMSNSPTGEGYYFDEEYPKKIYTKLRFDADGKEFDARTDIKKAYNHIVAIGSDNVQQDVAVEILDEIRFIRKEEVGSKHTPSHCGLEIVDFLCSMIAGETRLEEYKKRHSSLSSISTGTFLNIEFEDGEVIEFYDIVTEKLRRKTINYIDYEK